MAGGKGGGSQTVTNRVDPQTAAMQQEVFNRARQVSGQGYDPRTEQQVAGASGLSGQGVQGLQGAQGNLDQLFQQNLGFASSLFPYSRAGMTGADALGGDPNAINRLMNPYIQNVVDATGQQYDKLRNQATLATNDAATRAGAFGGSRQAVLQGERLGQLDQGQAATTAQLLQSGFNDAMGRAGQAANLGLGAGGLGLGAYGQAAGVAGQQLGASGQLFGMGDYYRQLAQQGLDTQSQNAMNRQNWDVRNLDVLRSGLPGFTGSDQTSPTYRNPFSSAAGGAATGAAVGGPWGAAIGGGLGLLGVI